MQVKELQHGDLWVVRGNPNEFEAPEGYTRDERNPAIFRSPKKEGRAPVRPAKNPFYNKMEKRDDSSITESMVLTGDSGDLEQPEGLLEGADD